MFHWLSAARVGASILLICGPSAAQPVGLTPDSFRKVIELGARSVVIERNQDQGATIPPDFARTSRACPPFCITPMIAAEGVQTVAELELIEFLETRVASGQGLLIDARLPEWLQKGTLPGAVNMPFTALGEANPYRDTIFEALGAVKQENGWDFTAAQPLILYSNGPWCDQAARAIGALRAAGYPAEKIQYYRGGAQDWVMLGLSLERPPSAY